MTDASSVAVGAVLQQFIDDHWCPIAFSLPSLSQLRPDTVLLIENY